MGSHLNFKSFGDLPLGEGNGGKSPGDFPLARQASLYSLTFDELQSTFSGHGKDFGSMNMDELLKSIWTAEESQAVTSLAGGAEGNVTGGNLQRQGSLTLPRTLSQKTVDEVWRDFMKETVGVKDGSGGGGSNMPQRQPTLGEMTLEDFLARAGVVREDAQQIGRPIDSGFYAELSKPNNNAGFVVGFQQPNQNNGLVANQMMENNNSVPLQPPTLALNGGGIRSSQQHPQQLLQQQQQQLHHHQPMQQLQQQPIFPKQTTVAFSSPMHLASTAQLAKPAARPSAVGTAIPSNNLSQVSGLQGGGMKMVGLRTGGVSMASGSSASQLSPDVIEKSNVDTLSPVPYAFSRGRKANSGFEKVVERRQRRMIKNRESAARSRQRKQAYTLELEAEIEKLKELNQELQRKQVEIKEMQKNQILESVHRPWGLKRQCLRRTFTGPW